MSLPEVSLNAPPRPAAYLAALVAIAAGGWFAWQGWTAWNSYVPLGVRVVSARVDTLSIAGLPKYGADIVYEFVYDGISMTANTVLKGNPEMSAKEAAKWVAKYPAGTETAAYLNSTDVDDIVLVRDNAWDLPLVIAVLGLFALLFLLWEDRTRWLPKVQEATGTSKRETFVDPRGRPPKMEMTPPPGMEGAIWDPSPGPDGLPRGWVRPEDQ